MALDKKEFLKKMKSMPRKPKKGVSPRLREVLRSRRDKELAIRICAVTRHVIQIVYKKTTTREVKKYDVEPYSYRTKRLRVGWRKMLYAYDVDERKIKGFAVANIAQVMATKNKYRPRWPVEFSAE